MQISSDEKLKNAAKLYAKKEGESLLAEVEEIRRQNISYLTPRADKTVKELSARKERPKRMKALFGICAAAACIAITIRLVSGLPDLGAGSRTPEAAPASPEPTDSYEPGVVEAETAEPSAPSAPGESDGGVQTGPAEILPISFELPAGYMVTNAEFDNGMSVYELQSDRRGDVVLTMYYEESQDSTAGGKRAGFGEVVIDGTPVPAKVQDSFVLLAFEMDGLSYTLSSKDDMGALMAFYRRIEKEA